jgi:hypothetical protein
VVHDPCEPGSAIGSLRNDGIIHVHSILGTVQTTSFNLDLDSRSSLLWIYQLNIVSIDSELDIILERLMIIVPMTDDIWISLCYCTTVSG